ncbi:MAG: Clp protease N-terminal domain-containing protein, partial [Anaerolineae bacterium]
MDYNRLTEKAREALAGAQESARERNHAQVEVEHLLLALLDQPGGVVPEVLGKMGVDVSRVRREAQARLSRLATVHGAVQLYLSRELDAVLREAVQEARNMHDEYVSTEHLFLAM